MENLATIRFELGINAQRLIAQYQSNNQDLEAVIAKGIERAFNEMLQDDNFEDHLVSVVKKEVGETLKKAVADWSIRHKIQDAIAKAIEGKIDTLATDWADKALKNIGA